MSPKLPLLTARQVIRCLEKAGFYVHHQSGSHVQLKHKARPDLRLTVPFHAGDLPKAVIRSIIRQAGMSVDDLTRFL